jgi:hypothetical protein
METAVTYWLSGKKPPKALTAYQRLDRNLKILMKRWDVDLSDILVGDTLQFNEAGKPTVALNPSIDEWQVINIDKNVPWKTYKGGAQKFINWYDKQ